ncbi:FAD-dependent oxidoreductase [soil metagenome]
MAHVRDVRQRVYEQADAPPVFEAMGIDVRAGRARFVDPHTIAITSASGAEERVRARFFIVATGGRPRPAEAGDLAGIEEVSYLTSASIFELEALPKRLVVLGGGPIGCEIAQALNRLGTETTLVQRGERLLPKDDPELSGMLLRRLEVEGVDVVVEAEAKRVAKEGDAIRITLAAKGAERTLVADALLVAIGRLPNVEGLDLEKAGVAFEEKGIVVDDRCRTSARHVFACGDVTGRYQLTHMSEHMAKVAATNIMLKLPSRIDTRHVPWCTFTDPELAHVGASEADVMRSGTAFDVYRFPYEKIDRAVTDGSTLGVLKVFATRRSGKILGATILGESAGDLICELAVAMRNGVTLRQLSDTIHPYPTLGLGVRRVADPWYVAKRSRKLVRVLQLLFGFRGPTREFKRGEIV